MKIQKTIQKNGLKIDEFKTHQLPRLPPQREIEFAIDVVPGATPAFITQYRMALVE